MAAEIVETESKHPVQDLDGIFRRLAALGCAVAEPVTHLDEYYDTTDGLLSSEDFVARLRMTAGALVIGFKGPRAFHADGTYSRIEIELPGGELAEVRAALSRQGLVRTWQLEKRRQEFRPEPGLVVAVDELPVVGFFVELEGEPGQIAAVACQLGSTLGPPDPRNYRELLVDRWVASGQEASTCRGVTFADGGRWSRER